MEGHSETLSGLSLEFIRKESGQKKEENTDVLLFMRKALYRINAFSGGCYR